jgi:hypothetical protein
VRRNARGNNFDRSGQAAPVLLITARNIRIEVLRNFLSSRALRSGVVSWDVIATA